MKKRLISFALSVVMAITVLSGTAFAMPFWDMAETEWYYSDVQSAYERGLIDGKTPTTFQPNDNLTYAEAVKLAACMNQQYLQGVVTLRNGSPWYQTYVDYCKESGIISKDYAWQEQATRAGYMEIFAKALPEAALEPINEVVDNAIGDVPMSHPQAGTIYSLYRAGILQGSDENHNCLPETNIRRSEVAAILTRMMEQDRRITFSMTDAALSAQLSETSLSLAKGETAQVRVKAQDGTKPFRYLWYCDGKSTGVMTQVLEIGQDLEPGTTEWYCVVTDANGSKATTPVLTVEVTALELPNGFSVEQQPQSVTAAYLEYVTLSVTVRGGTEPYSYQWQAKTVNGSAWGSLSSGNGSQLPLTARGTAQYRCVITDAEGSKIVTEPATLTVTH